jgi:tetratricopeptide (TPR) repeat protein
MSGDGHAIEVLERRLAADADDADSCYKLAILLLDEYSSVSDPDPERLDRAREHLKRAIALRPAHAPSHAALGYAYARDEPGAEQALECFREARRLDPRDKVSDVYVLTLLVAAGREEDALAEIEAAAPRHGVDLQALRGELTRAGFPADAYTLLANGFIHAGNFFRSALGDEAERVRNALERGRKRRVAAEELASCREAQRELERSFDVSRVPEPIRPLATWASRYGVGDDHCRPLLLKRLSKKQRAELIRRVDAHAETIGAWLNSFAQGLMPAEAGAFLYLMEGVEEVRELAHQP